MVKTLNTPSNSLHKRQSKDKCFQEQRERKLSVSMDEYVRLLCEWEKQFTNTTPKELIRKVFDCWYNRNILFVEPSNTGKRWN
jgi:hypothetical protein